jgi:hypothetical protein
VKQGIDFSIANHLEFLTNKWSLLDQLSYQMRRVYDNGVDICKQWTAQHEEVDFRQRGIQNLSNACSISLFNDHDDHSENSSTDNEEDRDNQQHEDENAHEKNRYHFDASMIDLVTISLW